MDTNQQVQNALDALNANAMFHMSLASKELFHSNFLYWLWKLDASKFLTLLDKLLDSEDYFCKRPCYQSYFASSTLQNK